MQTSRSSANHVLPARFGMPAIMQILVPQTLRRQEAPRVGEDDLNHRTKLQSERFVWRISRGGQFLCRAIRFGACIINHQPDEFVLMISSSLKQPEQPVRINN